MTGLPLFRALAHRNFRLYLAGQGVSIVGSWMQQVAMAWLVYQQTNSPVWLGLVAFAGQVPALVLTPLAGGLIDACDRRRLLLFTQSIALSQALVLAMLTLTGVVEPWHILALALLLGSVNALDIPTRQAFLSELVGVGDDLANAIALNSAFFNGARLVGPALAALLLALTSAGVCFFANACSYLAVVAALLAMRLPHRQSSLAARRYLGGVSEGLAYAWRSAPIRSLLLLIGFFNMAGMAEYTLLPVVAATVLEGDATTLGLLSGSAGAGAFAAAVFLACRRSVYGLAEWVLAAPLLFGLALLAVSFAATLWTAMLLLTVTGFALLLLTAAANTLLQTIVDEDKRGRVVSLYTMAVTGVGPLGGILAGFAADRFGAPLTLRIAGGACLVGAVAFAAAFRSVRAATIHNPAANPSTANRAPSNAQFSRTAVSQCRLTV